MTKMMKAREVDRYKRIKSALKLVLRSLMRVQLELILKPETLPDNGMTFSLSSLSPPPFFLSFFHKTEGFHLAQPFAQTGHQGTTYAKAHEAIHVV